MDLLSKLGVLVILAAVKFYIAAWVFCFPFLYVVRHLGWEDVSVETIAQARKRYFPCKGSLIPPQKRFIIIAIVYGLISAWLQMVVAYAPEPPSLNESGNLLFWFFGVKV